MFDYNNSIKENNITKIMARAEDKEYLNNYRWENPIPAKQLDYDFTKSPRRKHVFRRLLVEGELSLSTVRNYFRQRRDAEYFVQDLTEIYNVCQNNKQTIWLKSSWLMQEEIFINISKKKTKEKKTK